MATYQEKKTQPVSLNVCDAPECMEEKAWADTLCVRCRVLQDEMDEAGIGQRLDDHRGRSYTRLGKNGQVKSVACQEVQKARSNRISAQYADMAAEREAMSDAEKIFELLNLANSSVIGG